ncbi:MAG: autoinducer binding domain-containing protein [Roseitalea sp.]|uniref:helix-turn-helix transcriptional regulator n=1 Tax=Oceaniradius stylonematis TaxID=2184161 RepID=UPI001314C59E|nr:LuxR family transcriptional regulator [Oceaniradius stylonematis]MBO6552578.1 autoinducer binding domain-containing protein [Roseitalea sp.]MBO6950502.1 autoinducer binding domain-containing protein [Rhizobiaceae bacterium]MBO6591511.1 autoinducer binding domain-containing protein [Roseitalea sp.]MBO6599366.1 autoinducer binding domain-containing protein [Roseitalea sp.]MBO6612145.1 autoinducer binding domain-containing protein [Roseitalea sp.]
MTDDDAFDFVARVDEHKTLDALLTDLRQQASNFGFEHLILTGVPVGGQRLEPLVALNGWPEGWFKRYVAKDYARHDAVCVHAAQSFRSFAWSEVPRRLLDRPACKRIHGEASEFGLLSGYVVTMSSEHHWNTAVSFGSPEDGLVINKRDRARLSLMATYAGARAEEILGLTGQADPLTHREKEVLTHFAVGRTAGAIAELLSISERTVVQHAENFRRKLGVKSTVHAVAIAIKRRLIMP